MQEDRIAAKNILQNKKYIPHTKRISYLSTLLPTHTTQPKKISFTYNTSLSLLQNINLNNTPSSNNLELKKFRFFLIKNLKNLKNLKKKSNIFLTIINSINNTTLPIKNDLFSWSPGKDYCDSYEFLLSLIKRNSFTQKYQKYFSKKAIITRNTTCKVINCLKLKAPITILPNIEIINKDTEIFSKYETTYTTSLPTENYTTPNLSLTDTYISSASPTSNISPNSSFSSINLHMSNFTVHKRVISHSYWCDKIHTTSSTTPIFSFLTPFKSSNKIFFLSTCLTFIEIEITGKRTVTAIVSLNKFITLIQGKEEEWLKTIGCV
ncbi:hypothetical protein CWI39_1737p0010 [Hamiltosporidium magnivora]|uniref:Uncharacterized protein n=1 Tax=Hamiltosporidium magnivora TaxID=148818 RepID=A0A4Q9KZ17_9MICR|nr:hypothetical protein CWI39_1737p0010 [Hamiltosporidium magnivora]